MIAEEEMKTFRLWLCAVLLFATGSAAPMQSAAQTSPQSASASQRLGGGYTYFDMQKGHEFSIVTGFTYNWENKHTNYQNGIDWHVDWAASQFITKQVHVGLVGYLYNQLTGDRGSGATLGPIHSRVAGIGPQIGYIFPIGEQWQGYLNLKGYWEFAAQHRAEGWNVWLTFAISPAAHHDKQDKSAMPPIRK
jgi:hypothetical protein